jgi:hypothetical protein
MRKAFEPLQGAAASGQTQSVKKWYVIVLGAIAIGGAAYLYLHREDLGLVGSSSGSSSDSSRPATITWVAVDRSNEGFRLEMPADSKQIQVPAYNESGGADQVQMIYAYPNSQTSFSVAWEDNPPVERAVGGNPDQTLNGARDGALARTQTTLVSEHGGLQQGFPVKDFTGKNDEGGVFNARLILVGRRLYMLMAAFPAASARRDADVTHFFNSFQMVSVSRAE